MQLNGKPGTNNEINIFVDQCAARLNKTLLGTQRSCSSQLPVPATYKPLDLVFTHTFKCNYKKEFIQQTVTMTDGELFQDAAQMKLV
jgi:hypothetical protein